MIFLTFKDVKEQNFDACLDKIRGVISAEFRRHEEFIHKSTVSGEQEFVAQVLKRESAQVQMEEALLFLSRCLHRACSRKVVILIDE